MSEPLLLGTDIGTQGTKVVVITLDGKVKASGYASYQFEVPQPGWTEQDPLIWWQAFVKACREIWDKGIDPKQVTAIGISGQMHSLVLLDDHNKILRPAILWNDVRTSEECVEIENIVGKEKMYNITKNAVLPGFTAPKIRWVQKHEPAVFKQIHRVLMPKDYIVFRLSGEFSADVSDASGTVLFDVERRDWSTALIEALGFSPSWFPKVYESQEVAGTVTREANAETGLPEGIPIVAGAGDNAAAALGNGIYEEGMGIVSIGTSGTVFVPFNEVPQFEVHNEKLQTVHFFCHCLPNKWHAMGVTLSAGMSLSWFKTQFYGQSFEELIKQAEEVPPGAEKLIFLPYLNGERTPHNDPDARGVFFGLSYQHSRGHFVRSILEGVAFSMKECLELIKQLDGTKAYDELYLTGGAVKSELWSQILSNVFSSRFVAYKEREGPALGAAFLAGLGTGVWKRPGDIPFDTSEARLTEPEMELTGKYERLYDVYSSLYQTVAPLYKRLK
ncbi:xylulokinase [Bacillus songklensis]|uniref:Xylulose kinase n=1 Tax=Bacillus songklensis TaxID=1069116 RepID=A0ABV8AX31_9BACI